MTNIPIAVLVAVAAVFPPTASFAAEDAASLVGRWHGSYVCNQGRTGLQLLITKADGLAFEGEFAFHALPENPNVPSGRFAVAGALDLVSDAVTIDGVQWLEQPSGYQMVNLAGTLSADGQTIAGTVEFTGCGDFRVTLEGKQGVPGRSKEADAGKGK